MSVFGPIRCEEPQQLAADALRDDPVEHESVPEQGWEKVKRTTSRGEEVVDVLMKLAWVFDVLCDGAADNQIIAGFELQIRIANVSTDLSISGWSFCQFVLRDI